MAPVPDSEDEQFHKECGENWFPSIQGITLDCDIAGSLHDCLYKKGGTNGG
jgi:hypothetical protein